MAGLITLNVALSPPRTTEFDLEAVNAQMKSLVGYPIFEYWNLFADPQGPKLLEQHLESVWYALHGSSANQMQSLFCVPGAFREFLENDRKDVPLRAYAQDEKLKEAWMESRRAGGLLSHCCWYRTQVENVHLETERGLDGRVEKPYLFIGADGDAVCLTGAIEGPKKMGLVGDLTVKEVHSGHWSPLEVPDDISRIVLEWLDEKGFSG
jgi:pimeloyl-ACP methyl ester carboxylesterase